MRKTDAAVLCACLCAVSFVMGGWVNAYARIPKPDTVCWGMWDNDLWRDNTPAHYADQFVLKTMQRSTEKPLSLKCVNYQQGAITEFTASMRWIPKKREVEYRQVDRRIILSGDSNFTTAKDTLKALWDIRKQVETHVIEIRPYKRDRSTQANAFYWAAVIKPLADHLGYTQSEMHEQLLGEVFGWKAVRGLDGRERERPNRRTTEPEKMNTKEFHDYITHCQALAASLGITLEPYEGWQG